MQTYGEYFLRTDIYLENKIKFLQQTAGFLFTNTIMDLERGPVSLVSTTEELMERKRRGSGLEIR
jgi:hypothetical protein